MIRRHLQVGLLEERVAPAVFTVMNINDAGVGSLRQAVIDANFASGADAVVFDGAAFANPQTISLTSGQILIGDAVTITGPLALVTVDGNALGRIFKIDVLSKSFQAIAISNLSLTNGVVTGTPPNYGLYGGGIFNQDESITLNNVFMSQCATKGYGGAIGMGGGAIVINDSKLWDNTATGSGGAVMSYPSGAITLNRSTFSGNATRGGGGAVASYATFNATDCTFVSNGSNQNPAITSGGALRFSSGSATLRNCTFSGNRAKVGGAISPAASLNMQNCTIANNTATQAGGGISSGGSVTLTSTLIAGNSAPFGTDISGSVTCNYSLVGVTTNATISGANNLLNVTPQLTLLQSNGGPTQSHMLIEGSPGINAGSNPAALTNDQRGPGFPRELDGQADIGAVEGVSKHPLAVASSPDATTVGGTSQTVTVTFSDAQGIDVTTLATGNITVTGPNGFTAVPSFVTVDVNTNGSPRVATYSFTPPGGAWDTADIGTYQVLMNSSQVFDAAMPANAVPAGTLTSFAVRLPRVFKVTNTADVGPGSLRQAVIDANSSFPSDDTIQFAPEVSGTIVSIFDEIYVDDSLTITGPGSSVLTVTSNKQFRIFKAEASLTLSGLTLADGLSAGSAMLIAEGGAIHTSNVLTVQNCTFTGNRGDNAAGGGVGGAIFSSGPTLELSGCTFTNNGAVRGGGAAYSVTATINVDNCFFQSNGGGVGGGGAIVSNNSTTIVNSSFIQNGATFGGAINTAQLVARNCTFTSNSVFGKFCYGGAIVVTNASTLQNCTVTGNSAVGNPPGGGYGGGVELRGGGVSSIESTIVSGNVAGNTTSPSPSDIHIGFNSSLSAKSSAIGANPGTFTDLGGNLPFGANLQLKISTDGRHYVPAATSPCKDAGSNPAGLAFDGRGAGYARVVGAAADIGAYEIQAPPRVTSVQVNDGQVQRSRITQLTVTINQAYLTLPANQATAFQLKRVSDNAVVTLSTISSTRIISPPSYSIKLGFTGGPLQFGSLADGVYQLTALSTIADESGQFLDGNGDGIGGDDYLSPTTPGNPNRIFRLFGDVDGDADVDTTDFIQFRLSFGGINFAFDFDGDGAVAASDFIQFRLRFGSMI